MEKNGTKAKLSYSFTHKLAKGWNKTTHSTHAPLGLTYFFSEYKNEILMLHLMNCRNISMIFPFKTFNYAQKIPPSNNYEEMGKKWGIWKKGFKCKKIRYKIKLPDICFSN